MVNNIGLLGLIPVFLLIILTLWATVTSTGRTRTLALLGFLIFLSVVIGQMAVQLTRLLIAPPGFWGTWGMYIDFGTMGIYMFLIVLYALILAFSNFINERKWIIILPLIGLFAFLILMYNALTISFVLYGDAFLLTGLVLALVYMIVIPLYATFQYTRQEKIRGSPIVIWMWIVMLGTLLWASGLAGLFGGWYFGLDVSFFSALSLTIVSLFTIGWYLILVGYIFQRRKS
jgi:hypothetical protein